MMNLKEKSYGKYLSNLWISRFSLKSQWFTVLIQRKQKNEQDEISNKKNFLQEEEMKRMETHL